MQFFRKPAYKIKAVPFEHWRILRGDRVQVLSGKNKGMRGEVKSVLRDRNQVIVEGTNLVKKHQGGSGDMKGGVYLMEAPIAVSAVSLIDPQDDRPCKTRWVFLEGGAKERQSKRTGVIIPRNTLVLKSRKIPVSEGPLDTQPAVATKTTFAPSELIPKLNFNLAPKPKKAEENAKREKD